MNKIFLKIACAFVISIFNLIAAAEVNELENLHALCASQDKHMKALELLQQRHFSGDIDLKNDDGRTPLHLVASFVWEPNSSPPDHYGQGKVVHQRAETARRLVQLLITKGATNTPDIKGKDCIAIAGSAWSVYTPLQSAPSPPSPDQGTLNTRAWLKSQLDQAPKRIQQAIQESWPQSPDEIVKLIVSFTRL